MAIHELHRRTSALGRVAVLAVLLALVACNRGPSEAERAKARDDAVAEAVKRGQEEDRARDRELREQARADAARQMPRDTPPEAPLSPNDPMARAAARAQALEQAAAPYLARIKAVLVDPESMLSREVSLHDNGAALCAEINAKNRAGVYAGYVPAIVTGDRVYFFHGAREVLDPREPLDIAAFVRHNERLRCWTVIAPKAADPPKA